MTTVRAFMARLPDIPEKARLSQQFARYVFGPYTLLGYSVAGEETLLQVPELNLCFDIGRAPQFALKSDYVCISHGHMDHLAGLPYYISQRYFQGMKPATILVPEEIADPVDDMLQSWRRIERQDTPYDLVEMKPDQTFRLRKDFGIRCHRTHHGGPSLSYTALHIRHKLKPEFADTPGEELARLKTEGVEIQYVKEVPIITAMGDTGTGNVWYEPDVTDAQLLVTECTFFDKEHKRKAKAGRHLHVDQFIELLPELRNEHIVLTHVSRRTSLKWAKRELAKRVGEEQMRRIHFLMDLAGTRDVGDAAEATGIVEGA